MEISRIKRVHHFYYCLLIAVKMHGRENRFTNKIDENSFIYCWLKKAVNNNLFEAELHSEIEWLRLQMRGHGMRLDILGIVENIVGKLDFLLNSHEVEAM